jgi:hypothetical protein
MEQPVSTNHFHELCCPMNNPMANSDLIRCNPGEFDNRSQRDWRISIENVLGCLTY